MFYTMEAIIQYIKDFFILIVNKLFTNKFTSNQKNLL